MRIDNRELIKQLREWSDNSEYAKIVSAARLLPKNELDDEALTILADAYIEEKDFENAIGILESQRVRLDRDYQWHFRVGMVLYCISHEKECEEDDELRGQILERAQVSFARCMNLNPPEEVLEEAGNFMDMIEDDYNEISDDEEVDCSECEMYDEDELNAVEEHIEEYFGEFPTVFHEIKSPDIHCDIYIVPPTDKRDYYTLITVGMGAHIMNIPEELDADDYGRAELIMCLPKDWKIGESSEEWFWPISLLKNLARLPISCDTWLGWGHSVDNRGSFADNTKLCGSLLIYPEDVGNGADYCLLPGGEKVNFFEVIPIYCEEMWFKRDNDTHDLLEKMNGVSHILNINRENCCDGYYKQGLIDSVAMHSNKIVEKNLPLEEECGCNHLAIFLRWCIEHDLYSGVFFSRFPGVVESVKSGKPVDLRKFIFDCLAGELNSNQFSYFGYMFTRRYYDYNNSFNDVFYPANVDDCAEEYFGTEKYNSKEFQDEAYLFVPFDEDYYKRLSEYIERAYEVFYPEYLEYYYNEHQPLIKAAEKFLGCECIFPKEQRSIAGEMKKALAESENEDWFPHLICIDDLAESIGTGELSRILYDAAEPFFLTYVIAKTPKKGFFDKFEPLSPFLFSEEIKAGGAILENIYGRRPAVLELSESCSSLMLPQGDGAYLLLKGK